MKSMSKKSTNKTDETKRYVENLLFKATVTRRVYTCSFLRSSKQSTKFFIIKDSVRINSLSRIQRREKILLISRNSQEED